MAGINWVRRTSGIVVPDHVGTAIRMRPEESLNVDGGGGPFTPDQIPGLVRWLARGEGYTTSEFDGDQYLAEWADKSGLGNKATQANNTIRPKILGGQPCFKSGVFMDLVPIDLPQFTSFIRAKSMLAPVVDTWPALIKQFSPGKSGYLISRPAAWASDPLPWNFVFYNGSAETVVKQGQTYFQHHSMRTYVLDSAQAFRVSGINQTLANGIGNWQPGSYLGRGYDNNCWHGPIVEVVEYNRVLNADERVLVEAYMNEPTPGVWTPASEPDALNWWDIDRGMTIATGVTAWRSKLAMALEMYGGHPTYMFLTPAQFPTGKSGLTQSGDAYSYLSAGPLAGSGVKSPFTRFFVYTGADATRRAVFDHSGFRVYLASDNTSYAVVGGTQINIPTVLGTGPHVYCVVDDGANSAVYVDDPTTPVGTGNPASGAISSFGMGNQNGNSKPAGAYGDIFDVKAHNDLTLRTRAMAFLRQKFIQA